MIDRRQFLEGVLAASGALCAPSWLGARSCDPEFRSGRVLADLHVHPLLDNWVEHSHVGKSSPRLTAAAKSFLNKTRVEWACAWRAGVDVMCVAHYDMFNELATMPTDPNPDAPRQALRLMDQLEVQLATKASPFAELARNAAELGRLTSARKALPDGTHDPAHRIAVVHTLEGGHHLGADPDAVALFAERGVAVITVTHFFNKGAGAAGNPLPFFPDAFAPRAETGLTELGLDIVSACESAGVLVDVSHATARTVADILCHARRPLVATHSSARALGEHPYSLYDEHIQEIARRGGLIGVILLPHWLGNYTTAESSHVHGGLDDTVRTILHVVKICGTHEHIAIGSDYKGYIPGPYDMERLSEIHRLRRKLESVLTPRQVDDVLADNAIRFLSRSWGTS